MIGKLYGKVMQKGPYDVKQVINIQGMSAVFVIKQVHDDWLLIESPYRDIRQIRIIEGLDQGANF